MLRTIAFLHRYTGVAVGWLMTLWCLSGFVMMYQGYPELTNPERLRGIAPLDLSLCCRQPPAIPADRDLNGARINMLSGIPVLRLPGANAPIDLRSGQALEESAIHVQEVAGAFARAAGITTTARELGFARVDQWTLLTSRRNQAMHHLAFQDTAGTEIYVSGTSGEVIQDTNRRERTLAWMGAIPHWLYLTALRSQPRAWTQVVIWTAVAGTFLTVAGLFLGISRLNWNGARIFPFRGLWNWHHIAGTFFGVLALTWVFSGLMTMNPWGLLESSDDGSYASELRGGAHWADLQRFLVEHGSGLAQFVELRVTPFNGALFVLAFRQDGSSTRLDAAASAVQVRRADIETAAAKLAAPLRSLDLLQQEDAYYYGHKQQVSLPVFRLLLADSGQTRMYIDPATGAMQTLDLNARRTRWWESAMHNMDLPGLRARPLWDFIVLLLLAGVTAVCGTGTWLAWRVVKGRPGA